VSDLIEAAAATDPTDATSLPREPTILSLPPVGESADVTVRFVNRVENADVFFLVDTTGSMSEERMNLIDGMVDVVIPALTEAFVFVRFGAGGFDDYPVASYGSGTDVPFYLLTTMIDGLVDEARWSEGSMGCPDRIGRLEGGANMEPDIVDALKGLACHGGGDLPESAIPALYATATGMGLSWDGGSVAPQTECPTGTLGYPCFSPDALPIIVLVGDAAFHNGPAGALVAYEGIPGAPAHSETVDALVAIGARVVTIYSGDGAGQSDYVTIARDTGAVTPDGSPLAFDISPNGSGIDMTVVNAMRALAEGTTQDVRASAVDDDDDAFDAATLVSGIVTGEGYAPDGSAGPGPTSYASKDATTFMGVQPSSEFELIVTLSNASVEPMESARVLVLRVNAIGTGGAAFASRRLFLVSADRMLRGL
jgi:hypothetical protein